MADASKILLTEGDSPATPASGTVALYCKTNHKYYSKGSDGVERSVTVGLTDSSDATLSGTPKVFTVYDSSGTPYYFKCYPTKT